MRLFNRAPVNIVPPTPSTPLNSMDTVTAHGNVFRVRTLHREQSLCGFTCFGLFPIEEQVGVLDGGETKTRMTADFPYMTSLLYTKDIGELKATAESTLKKHMATSGFNETFQFSILRGEGTQRTYVILAKVDDQEGENWNSAPRTHLYYHQAGYDKRGQALSLETVEKTVKLAVQRLKRQLTHIDAPLDEIRGFQKCDDYSHTYDDTWDD